jgi:D-alanyl-D-alanine carboxypeptidase
LNRLAQMAALCLALLCLFTIGAGAAVAHLLPARLDLFNLPAVTGSVRASAGGQLSSASAHGGTAPPTADGVAAQLTGLISSGAIGANVGALVVDYSTGKVLFSQNDDTGFTPASTTKVATAVAAIDTFGAGHRFTTSVGLLDTGGAGKPTIVLIGGGDPTLSAGRYPSSFYPRPAALVTLAASTAKALHAKGIDSVRLTYDNSLFVGPVQAEGWPSGGASYIETGNAAPVTGLEVDQGRLALDGRPQDDDDTSNFAPRSMRPGLDAAMAFARFLRKDGIKLGGSAPRQTQPGQQNGQVIASVHSITLAQMVQWMLVESNNMIAETLARHVAIAIGKPATFSGAAAAVGSVDGKLGVRGIHLFDGSGLSPLDKITPHALVKLVEVAAGQGGGPGLRSVITGLPVAGFTGTLGPGSSFGPFGRAGLGVVRAKTGNISGVATLAGIAYAADGDVLAFAFMGNGIGKTGDLKAQSSLIDLATAIAGCGCR